MDRFIPPELAIAPPYSSGKLPNLIRRKVPIDCNTSIQVWSPKANAILLPEEVNVLRSDRLRVEVICSRLVWLLGANCSEHEDYLVANEKLIHHWEDIVYFACKYGFRPHVIDLLFSPPIIRPLYTPLAKSPRTQFANAPTHWVMEPACWEIFFLELKPVEGGFKAEPRTKPLSVIVWTGEPITKLVTAS